MSSSTSIRTRTTCSICWPRCSPAGYREHLRRRRRRPEHLPLPRREYREYPELREASTTGARSIRLEQNYRSTQNILDAANAVIRHNTGRKGKTLWTENGRGEVVTVKTTFNEGGRGELRRGADPCQLQPRCGTGSDHAVLYRMNAQSNALEYAFKRNGMPYTGHRRHAASSTARRSRICWPTSASSTTTTDDLRLRRIINVPARKIGPTTVDRAQLIADGGGRAPL